jgi:xanthine/CO dehydrogenase XdhC/CoxF family maturation factor
MVVAVDGTGTRPAPGRTAAFERDGVLYDVLLPPIAVAVLGDGIDAGPLAALAQALGWVAHVVRKDDPLPELDERSAAVIMTHNYARDLELLRQLAPTRTTYVGLLGPRERTHRLLAELGTGCAAALHGRLRAPVGLDIGASTPEEIALAVLAEISAAFAGRGGGPLADRPGPIHGER